MAGKPETAQRPGTSNSALQNVLVYVSGDGFSYAQQQPQPPNGAGPGATSIKQNIGPTKVPTTPTSLQTFYNANGFQNAATVTDHVYQGPAVRSQPVPPPSGFAVKSREEGGNFVAVMGGELVFPRCDSVRSETAESSCSSLGSSCGGDSQPMQDTNAARSSDVINSGASIGVSNVNVVNNAGAVLGVSVNNNNSSGVHQSQIQQQCKPQDIPSVAAPFGWKRLLTNNIIIYVSPSNTALNSLEQVKAYLQTQGTCKCGLECPLNCDAVFNFDPKVATRPWSAGAPPSDLTRLCNHKRKLLPLQYPSHHDKKLDGSRRIKKRKLGPIQYGSSASVSQLLAQRGREREQRSSKEAVPTQQTWGNGSPQQNVLPDGSSVLVQSHMLGNPVMNRVQYPPGYHENNSGSNNHSGNQPIVQHQPNQAPMPPNASQTPLPPPPQYFRYNPVGCNISNCNPGINPNNQQSGMVDNGQVICNNNGNPSTPVPFSAANGTYIHQPVVMTSMGSCGSQDNNLPGQNSSLVIQQSNCVPPGHMIVSGHQHPSQNFIPQQQRLHMGCPDGNECPHTHCNQGGKPAQMINQSQIFMPQHDSNVMTHIQQQAQPQQTQPQQQIVQHQHHSHPMQHNIIPQHIMNSPSPRPTGALVNQQVQSMLPSHQNYDPARVGPQFHAQHQIVNPQEQNKNVQVPLPHHVHLVDVNKVNYNITGKNNTQVMIGSGPNSRGIVCENYSAVQTSRNENIHQPSAMVLQTSQGQVMIPPGQVASALVVQNQQGGQNGSINVGTSQPMRMMNLPNSSVVVQGSPGTAVLSSGHTINPQGQTMVLHSQHGSSMVSQGLQVQTVGNHQGGVMLQNHHNPPLSSSSSNINSNSVPAGSGIVTHHQRSVPPWQQNRTNQLQNAIINQQNVNQTVLPNPYERVPPLHHHSHLPVWQEDNIRKKGNRMQGKSSAVKKQKSPYIVEHHHHHNTVLNSDQCPNVDVRHIQQDQKPPQNYSNSNVPSFMEDPSGYLAQQTALLNSTISRQTGNGANIICHSPCSTQNQTIGEQNSGQIVINLPVSACSPVNNQGVPLPSNVLISSNKQQQPVVHQAYIRNPQQLNNMKVHSRNNSVSSTGGVSYQTQSQPGTPDSSDVSPERSRCQACPSSSSSSSNNNSTSSNNNSNINNCTNSTALEGMQANTIHLVNTKQLQLDDSPVTSSTYIDNRGHNPPMSVSVTDSRGPIQGGTVSTSNRSPADIVHRVHPDAASPVAPSTPTTPLSSTQNCRIVNSPESSVSSIFVSVSSPFTSGNMTPVLFTTQQNPIISRSQDNNSQLTRQQQPHLNINIHVQDIATSRIPAIVTTMASGHTVSSNTITSVLAGRANTATVSVNPTTIAAPTIPSAVLTSQPVSHQVAVTKSPLEMVQSVVSSIQVPTVTASQSDNVLKPTAGPNLPAGSILVSNNGQLIVANTSGPPTILSPQQNLPKIGHNSPMPPMSGNSIVTSVTGAVTQVIPAVGVTQQVLGQPTVLVNTLPAPLLFQPGVMTVDGTMNAVQIPHLAVATGNMLQQGQVVEESRIQQNNGGAFSPRAQPALLSPEGSNGKRKSNAKKRKVPQTVANMLHMAAQQNSPNAGAAAGMVVQQQQPQQNYGNSAPMLQALTILPGKTTGHFGGTQQLIATANVLQPLNLVQNFPTIQQFIVPAGLSGMVMATGDGTATLLQDAVQLNVLTPVQGPTGTVFGQGQSILAAGPAGMVIRTPTNNNNGGKVQHVTQGGGQQFITANSPNQFLMNSPAFSGQLSPMLANVSPTNQQIHSFNTASTASQNRTSGQAQHQEFIQCGQTLMVPCTITQTPSAQNTTVVQQNTTIVQQQTTMVSNNQQSLDHNQGPATSSSSSLSLNQHNFILNNGDGKQPQNFIITTDKQNQGNFILSPNTDNKHQGTHIILNNINTTEKQTQPCSGFLISQPDKSGQICDNFILTNSSLNSSEKTSTGNFIISSGSLTEKQTKFAKHSVSTQTAANQQVLQVPTPVALVVATTNTFCQTSTSTTYSGSPPDTTTHSPVDASGNVQSPGLNSEVPSSSVVVGSTDDNLSSPTSSSDPSGRSQPMVHCVSSSNEQDSPDWQAKEVNMSPSPAIFSPPSNVDTGYNRGGNGMSKTVSVSSYVESSSTIQQFEGDRLHKQHSADEALSRQIYEYHRIESSRMSKRKHSSICSESEARIHTSTLSPQDDDDDSGSFGGSGSETECGADPPGPSAGDLVWGAAHGFRSWPGKLVGPAPTPGRVWVRWFGGPGTGPLSEVDPQDLKTLSEGLEAHHRARKKFRKSRKLDSQLENAIQEAMAELDRMSETPQQGPPMPPQSLTVSDSSCSRTRRNHR